MLLWPRRATVSVRACYYNVQASPRRRERAELAKQCHRTLEVELEELKKKPLEEQPDTLVSDYLSIAKDVVEAIARSNAAS